MELLLVFLSTAVGTVVGVAAAILMMNRKKTAPAVGDAALRMQLQNTEWALAAAGRDVEELRKQLADRDSVKEELERTQQQLVAIISDKERQAVERIAAEQRATQSLAEVDALRERLDEAATTAERVAELETALAAATAEAAASRERLAAGGTTAQRVALEAMLAAAEDRAAAASEEIAAVQDRLDAGEAATQRVAELEAALATSEVSAAQKVAELETALATSTAEAAELRNRVDHLTEHASAVGSGAEELARRIADLNAEVEGLHAQAAADHERYQRAAANASELESLLQRERQSAVEAMELLSQAQDKFSGSFASAH